MTKMKNFERSIKKNSMKKTLIAGLFASCSVCGLAEAQTVYDIPAKYVRVCYGWHQERDELGGLSAEQLTTALQRVLAQSPAVPGRTTVEQGDIAAALRWSETLEVKKDCYRASPVIINVQGAVELVRREKREGKEKAKSGTGQVVRY
jgi:hypothetical protein